MVSNFPPNFSAALELFTKSVLPNLALNITSMLISLPSRFIIKFILSPGLYLETCSCNSGDVLTATPLILISTSPFLIPAALAAPPSNTSVIKIPSPSLYFVFSSANTFFNSSSDKPSLG